MSKLVCHRDKMFDVEINQITGAVEGIHFMALRKWNLRVLAQHLASELFRKHIELFNGFARWKVVQNERSVRNEEVPEKVQHLLSLSRCVGLKRRHRHSCHHDVAPGAGSFNAIGQIRVAVKTHLIRQEYLFTNTKQFLHQEE